MPSLADRLASRQLIVVTGKGGVGKTTLTALLGQALAARGRRVLLLEADLRERLYQLLGTEPSGGRVLEAGARLWIQHLDPRTVVEDLVHQTVRVAAIARRVIRNPIFQHFAAGAPGLKEMATLGYAHRTVQGAYRHHADIVVLDAPATGHGVSMLNAPLLLQDAVSGGELGAMAAELGAWIADPARAAVVVGTLAEEMPVQEAIELVALLRRPAGGGAMEGSPTATARRAPGSREPAAVVVNRLYPPFPARLAHRRRALGPVRELWSRRRALNERDLGRLRAALTGPLVELPLLPLPQGPALLAGLAQALEPFLDAEAGV